MSLTTSLVTFLKTFISHPHFLLICLVQLTKKDSPFEYNFLCSFFYVWFALSNQFFKAKQTNKKYLIQTHNMFIFVSHTHALNLSSTFNFIWKCASYMNQGKMTWNVTYMFIVLQMTMCCISNHFNRRYNNQSITNTQNLDLSKHYFTEDSNFAFKSDFPNIDAESNTKEKIINLIDQL